VSAPLVVEGFAARTGVKTELYDGVFETILPGSFRRSISSPETDVTFNLLHGEGGSGLPLARVKAGTLTLSEVETGPQTGLWMRASLDEEDPDAVLLGRKLASGAMKGDASFAFRIPKNGQTWQHFEDHSLRTISAVNLAMGDVSAVVHGAYPQAHIEFAPRSQPRVLVLPDFTTEARRDFEIYLSRAKG
jgi:HK97 family phage prohead protease